MRAAIASSLSAWLVAASVVGCKAHPPAPSAADVADRGWQAHELVVAAGEHEPTCAAAGLAMQRVFAAHRQAFVEALALDQDPDRLREATTFLEAHEDRYHDLETRMEALSERCATEPSVLAAFRQMESP